MDKNIFREWEMSITSVLGSHNYERLSFPDAKFPFQLDAWRLDLLLDRYTFSGCYRPFNLAKANDPMDTYLINPKCNWSWKEGDPLALVSAVLVANDIHAPLLRGISLHLRSDIYPIFLPKRLLGLWSDKRELARELAFLDSAASSLISLTDKLNPIFANLSTLLVNIYYVQRLLGFLENSTKHPVVPNYATVQASVYRQRGII